MAIPEFDLYSIITKINNVVFKYMNKNYNKLIDEFLKKNTTFQKYKFNKKAKDSLNAFIRRTLKNELMKSKPKAKPRK